MNSDVKRCPKNFYDELASQYQLIGRDWRTSAFEQGEILDGLLKSALHSQEPLKVLDCSCGIGTQAIGLLAKGHSVHGTDLSPEAVRMAERSAAELKLSLSTGVADFRSLASQVQGTFDAVISCDNSLAHLLDERDLQRAAENIFAKVRPGGIFLASIRNYDLLLKSKPSIDGPNVIREGDKRRIVFQLWAWRQDTPIYDFDLFLVEESENNLNTSKFSTTARAWSQAELSHVFREAGFGFIDWLQPNESRYYQPVMIAKRVDA